MSTEPFNEVIENLCQNQHLSYSSGTKIFDAIIKQQLTPMQIASFITALKSKGEAESEIQAATHILLNSQLPFYSNDSLSPFEKIADCCGTGGDGHKTLNISTAVAILASTQGLKIAKHGNRAISSNCGASDILNQLDINIHQPSERSIELLEKYNLCFIHAPDYNPALKNVAPIRSNLKFKTIFNLLGPLINPARPTHQLIGVYNPKYTKCFANILKKQNLKRAAIIHGSGTDECALHGPTVGHILFNNEIKEIELQPESLGLKRYPLQAIRGQDAAFNAKALVQLLQGQGEEAYQAIVALNTGLLFFVTETTDTIEHGVQLAQSLLKTDIGYLHFKRYRDAAC